ncbi:condensation domain-containing protein [Streptomyces sp. Ac-502]|uniref:condensation domain-containing protein n=1 Tax=Streptomyces sp. Ac-502 TaxID=3342801 RepID=UPI0038627DF0
MTGTDSGTDGEPDGATDVVDRAPATYQQQGFIAQDHHPTPHVFNVALRITLTGGLDLPALRTALSQLIARHESLRTRFVQEDGQWWQEILRPRPVDLQVEDLTAGRGTGAGTAGSAGTMDAEIEQISAQVAATRFDFGEGVAPKLRLVRSGPSTWVLFFVLHHSTCDGWAVSVLLSDFAALYGAAATGTPHTLASTVPQPTEYARWQRETAPERPDQRVLKYWARELDGAPFELGLPLDRPRPETLSGQGRVVLFSVDTDLLADVERLARKCGTTPYAVTTAALGQLIGTLSGRTDVVANVAYANRERRAFESLMACTAVGLPLRIRLDGDGTFTDLVRQVAHTSIEGIDHIMSLRRLVEPLREEMGVEVPDHVPFGFAYQSSLQTDIELPGVAAVVEDLAVPAARTDLSVGLIPAGDTLTGYMEYSTDLWEQPTVEGWADAYVTLLAEEVRAALED